MATPFVDAVFPSLQNYFLFLFFYLTRRIVCLHTSHWSTAKTALDDVGRRLHSGSNNSCQRCVNVGPAYVILAQYWQSNVASQKAAIPSSSEVDGKTQWFTPGQEWQLFYRSEMWLIIKVDIRLLVPGNIFCSLRLPDRSQKCQKIVIEDQLLLVGNLPFIIFTVTTQLFFYSLDFLYGCRDPRFQKILQFVKFKS